MSNELLLLKELKKYDTWCLCNPNYEPGRFVFRIISFRQKAGAGNSKLASLKLEVIYFGKTPLMNYVVKNEIIIKDQYDCKYVAESYDIDTIQLNPKVSYYYDLIYRLPTDNNINYYLVSKLKPLFCVNKAFPNNVIDSRLFQKVHPYYGLNIDNA